MRVLTTILLLLITNQAIASEYPILIWCLNTKTLETKKPINLSENWCHYWQWWMNIFKPSESQYKILKSLFTPAQIINRLPIINAESQFNSNAIGYHKYWKDCWLLQIRDIRWWCKMSDYQQLTWLKTRIESQVKWNCSHWVKYWEERLMRCIYNRHNWQLVAYNHYDNKLIALRNFYFNYFK